VAAARARLGPALDTAGFDLEELTISRAGTRSVVRVAVDRDGGVDLDAVADASRLVSDLLDADGDSIGLTGTYVLEVTSPGVDRPLTELRHWRRARGHLVTVDRAAGPAVRGRVLGADEDGVDLAVPTGVPRKGRPVRTRIERVLFADVVRAAVEVEFGVPADSRDAGAAASGADLVAPGGAELDEPDADEPDADELDGDELDGDELDGDELDGDELDDDELDDDELDGDGTDDDRYESDESDESDDDGGVEDGFDLTAAPADASEHEAAAAAADGGVGFRRARAGRTGDDVDGTTPAGAVAARTRGDTAAGGVRPSAGEEMDR
jgi:ribosome maturation factor RimP